jgi:hypothetical protein
MSNELPKNLILALDRMLALISYKLVKTCLSDFKYFIFIHGVLKIIQTYEKDSWNVIRSYRII